jgi:hypothetical protein
MVSFRESRSNARFNALDKLVLNINYVKMPIGNGGGGIAAKGRPLANMAQLKRRIVEGKAENNCPAHALVIEIANLTNDPDYKAFRQGRKIHAVVDILLATTGIDMTNGGGISELMKFQKHFKDYRIVVF